jgi:hypothetical protein
MQNILKRRASVWAVSVAALALLAQIANAQDYNQQAQDAAQYTQYAQYAPMGLGLLFGFGLIMVAIALIICAAVYVYSSLATMYLAKKIGTKNPWLAWIPVANLYLISQMAGMPWWPILFLIGCFIPGIGALFAIALLVFFYIWFWKIFEKVGKPGWWILLLLIPAVGQIIYLVLLGVAAWGKNGAPKQPGAPSMPASPMPPATAAK